MKPVVLVVTVVHWPDDTRIRERLIRTLSPGFDVVYATRPPGPSDNEDIEFVELAGGRIVRNLRAIRIALTSAWDVMIIHDPELVPCGVLARLLRRRPVVWDVHEDFPASAYTRSWVPSLVRRPLSVLLRWLMRLAEQLLSIALAEPGYQRLFSSRHPVFVNYPDTSSYPDAGGDPTGPAVYLGDITTERGVEEAVAACDRSSAPLQLIGRVEAKLRARLEASAGSQGVIFEGQVPNSAAVAMLASASVGLAPLHDLPNYRHSQPTKILEYLAMGLPVVASDLPGTRELVEGLDAVELVPAGDVAALAGAVGRARSPELIDLARRQASRIRSEFHWPSGDVVAFYESLL